MKKVSILGILNSIVHHPPECCEESSGQQQTVGKLVGLKKTCVVLYLLRGSTAKAESDGPLKGPVPAELQAATLNSYSVPSNRRVT